MPRLHPVRTVSGLVLGVAVALACCLHANADSSVQGRGCASVSQLSKLVQAYDISGIQALSCVNWNEEEAGDSRSFNEGHSHCGHSTGSDCSEAVDEGDCQDCDDQPIWTRYSACDNGAFELEALAETVGCVRQRDAAGQADSTSPGAGILQLLLRQVFLFQRSLTMVTSESDDESFLHDSFHDEPLSEDVIITDEPIDDEVDGTSLAHDHFTGVMLRLMSHQGNVAMNSAGSQPDMIDQETDDGTLFVNELRSLLEPVKLFDFTLKCIRASPLANATLSELVMPIMTREFRSRMTVPQASIMLLALSCVRPLLDQLDRLNVDVCATVEKARGRNVFHIISELRGMAHEHAGQPQHHSSNGTFRSRDAFQSDRSSWSSQAVLQTASRHLGKLNQELDSLEQQLQISAKEQGCLQQLQSERDAFGWTPKALAANERALIGEQLPRSQLHWNESPQPRSRKLSLSKHDASLVQASGWPSCPLALSDLALLSDVDASGNVPVIHVQDVLENKNTFFKALASGLPVMIRGGALAYVRSQAWSRELLLGQIGDIQFDVSASPYSTLYGATAGQVTLSSFSTDMSEKLTHWRDCAREMLQHQKERQRLSLEDSIPPYIFNELSFDTYLEHPDLFLLETLESGERDYPLLSLIPGSTTAHRPQVFIGPPGSGAPEHFHTAAANYLIYGKKLWYLTPPGRSLFGTVPALWRFANEPPAPFVCTQGPGDLIIVPRLWGHAVLNMDVSVGFAINFDEPFSSF